MSIRQIVTIDRRWTLSAEQRKRLEALVPHIKVNTLEELVQALEGIKDR